MSEGSRPPEDVPPLAPPVGLRQARMHEFFRRRLQAAREAGHDCAWVYRSEIVAEGEAMGLNEAQSLAMAQDELVRNWYDVPTSRTEEKRRFIDAVFSVFPGLCRRYGYSP